MTRLHWLSISQKLFINTINTFRGSLNWAYPVELNFLVYRIARTFWSEMPLFITSTPFYFLSSLKILSFFKFCKFIFIKFSFLFLIKLIFFPLISVAKILSFLFSKIKLFSFLYWKLFFVLIWSLLPSRSQFSEMLPPLTEALSLWIRRIKQRRIARTRLCHLLSQNIQDMLIEIIFRYLSRKKQYSL